MAVCLLALGTVLLSLDNQIFLELSVWMVCFGGRKFIVLADSISKWIWSWANYYNSKTWMKGILFDLLLWCLERVPKLFSQMVVWWWIVTLQSVKKSPTKHIPKGSQLPKLRPVTPPKFFHSKFKLGKLVAANSRGTCLPTESCFGVTWNFRVISFGPVLWTLKVVLPQRVTSHRGWHLEKCGWHH